MTTPEKITWRRDCARIQSSERFIVTPNPISSAQLSGQQSPFVMNTDLSLFNGVTACSSLSQHNYEIFTHTVTRKAASRVPVDEEP